MQINVTFLDQFSTWNNKDYAVVTHYYVYPYVSFRFFTEIASDCETIDTSNHSLSFISDANVLALHRLLWINQEKIGDYLSSSRFVLNFNVILLNFTFTY